MRKIFLTFACIFLTTKMSYGSYIATYYPALIENSKIIAFGKIVSVQSNSFKIIVLKNIKCCKTQDTLTVQKFSNWTCATRFSDYIVNQEGVFFIDLDKEKKLKIIGAGNEGEIIVKKDTCYLKDYSQKLFPARNIDFISKYEKFVSMEIKTVILGIKLYMENMDQINKESLRDGDIVYKYESPIKINNDFYTLVLEQKKWLTSKQ